jgi:nucleoside-diphosphate-sugar epimerase
MKILVTGSAGHLGEALVRTLQQTEHEVIGLDILPSAFTSRVGSIVDRHFVRQCMQGVNVVLHAATLHKPHVLTHSFQDFIDTNISGTTNLLEEAVQAGVEAFIFTSTTSAFGDAMKPLPGGPATWITEAVTPIPKNIYGVTKIAAENLCKLFHQRYKLPCLILRTSRFFLEADDQEATRTQFVDLNAKANEFLYRRVDLADIVDAHLLAMTKAKALGFGRYIISATTPFSEADLLGLQKNAHDVVSGIYPDFAEIYAQQNWAMFPSLDRVYVNELARQDLGWQPKYDFRHVLDSIKAGADFFSPLARQVGSKVYHDWAFGEEPYPAEQGK